MSTAGAADRALAAGDRQAALRLLEEEVRSAPGYEIWMKLAALRRATGSVEAALQAIHAALALSPLDFTALLAKATILEQLGGGHAGEAYAQALAQRPASVPAHLATAVAHAEAKAKAFVDAGRERLRRAVAPTLDAATADEQRRIERFCTNALRETRVHHSAPTHFHFPGLSEREFHDRSAFPWLAALEAATGEICAEFEALHASRDSERVPYLRYAGHEPIGELRALNRSRDWTAIHLLEDGTPVEANAAPCPRTMALLGQVGQPHVAGMSPSAMFSLLAPHTRIPPHTGVTNTRLVCHLPLIVPPECWFRVGAETRLWRAGEAIVFDDSIEHEAMNPSDQLRVVLIFDVWHPGLGPRERHAVAAAMGADSAAAGSSPA